MHMFQWYPSLSSLLLFTSSLVYVSFISYIFLMYVSGPILSMLELYTTNKSLHIYGDCKIRKFCQLSHACLEPF